jgi:TfoX/Sxy family transcriptional regulator of competence genes
MKLVKPSAGLIAEFKAVLAELPRAEPRKMFGYDAAFVHGNMAVGLWRDTCVIKVADADQKKLIEAGQAQPFAPMTGRVMSGWVELSVELSHDPEELVAWAQRAIDYVSTLPPNAAKRKRPTTKKANQRTVRKKSR